ncbi:LANO_0H00298g1_1 [Lachancea nothofagi CBS 11611]|uniref:LANO_0H00298g1_1 n=1 Tax=Lachancea nothofagi CBS 11611 TaxID=1266666 RepID=A0A1G4KKX0_9SACH|nr:LANO_0H00298g1_1 [Lachancea nothofagi CBS 11611]
MERSESASFSQFSHSQIQKARDAFQFIDEDGDGKISETDLMKMYSNLGKTKMEGQIKEMLAAEKDGELTFPEFLTLMGDRLGEFPEEQEMSDALRVFALDSSHDLNIDVGEMKEYLRDAGFEDIDALDGILKQFCTTQLSGERIFKGRKFLETVE